MADLASLPKDWVVTSGQFTKSVHTDVYAAIDPTNPENSLHGKTVLVTGASRGIGANSIAPALVKAGAKAVVLLASNTSKLVGVEKSLTNINPLVETLVVGVDISSAEQVSKAWSVINVKFPRVHVLVNNAGVESSNSDKMMHDQDADIFFKNFEVNVKGTHLVTQNFLQAALPWASATDKAVIITMTSSTAWGVWPFLAAYSMSKAANIHYTATLAAAYPETLLAISLNPGMNDTEIIPQALRAVGFNYNNPALTGGIVAWLVADPARSQFLNGRVITAEWDVEELVARSQEITSKNLLTMQLQATLGASQFLV